MLRPGDNEWIESTIDQNEMRKNLNGIAAAKWPQNDRLLSALQAVVDSGIDLNHITTIARQAQEQLLYHTAYTLSDSSSDEPIFRDVTWAVFETSEDGKPLRQMNVLHELCGLVDPSENA